MSKIKSSGVKNGLVCIEITLAVQREMLKDQSGSKGGSLAEALGSYLQGTVDVVLNVHLWIAHLFENSLSISLKKNPQLCV